jgi:hypothetical protein
MIPLIRFAAQSVLRIAKTENEKMLQIFLLWLGLMIREYTRINLKCEIY